MKNFKKWFQLMWKNRYIQIFIIAAGSLVFIITKAQQIIDESGLFWLLATLFIPLTTIFCISYFAFYRFWKKIKNTE